VDLNAQTGATCLTVTHNIGTARTVPDNIGLLYQKHLAMFGPRHELLTSAEPVVRQFMNGRKQGPIGMSEEKDSGEQEKEKAAGGPDAELPPIEPQMLPTWPLVRRSMSSPHGSHAFLKEQGMREKIKVNAKFGEDGLEPSEEPPAKPMEPDEFLKSLGLDGDGKGGESKDQHGQGEDGQDTAATQRIPVPAGGEEQRPAHGPKAGVAAAAGAATAAVAMHKARSRDGASQEDDSTRPSPVAGGRPRPTPDGRPRPTPRPTPSPHRESEPATASTAVLQRPTDTDEHADGDGNGDGAANGGGSGSSNARSAPAGSRRSMLASLLKRGER